MPSISVIIPAYNEEKRLPSTLKGIRSYFDGHKDVFCDYEVIVVNDGSRDNTSATAKEAFSSVVVMENPGNCGKGYSVRNGILNSKKSVVLMSDADLSTPIEEVEKMLSLLEGGFDVVIGSRGLRDSDIIKAQPFYRQFMGKTFNVILKVLGLTGFSDTQCGFKCFKREAALDIFGRQRIDGFAFDVEALFIAGLLGYKVKEVPVKWINSPESKVGIFSASVEMFFDLLRIRINAARGYYRHSLRGNRKSNAG